MADNRCEELDFGLPVRFPDVIASEYDEIDARRTVADGTAPERVDGRPPRLKGLALSGGGVRSATFNLGVLQALAEAGKLWAFDYLSTVSGGGYTGGWWSAWLARDARKREKDPIFPPHESIENERDARRARMTAARTPPVHADRPQVKDSAVTAAEDPIHHLRLFSNVMTPRKGLLSGDTWRAIAVIGRNIILTWLILLPILLAAIMVGQAWFRLVGEPKSHLERLQLALYVPGLLFIGSVVSVAFWMFFSRRWQTLGDKIVVTLSTAAFFALTLFLTRVMAIEIPPAVKAAAIAWVIYVVVRLVWWRFTQHARWSERDYWRNRAVYLQTKTLAYSAFTLVIFLFAGFGHVIFDFLLTAGTNAVAKAGGWSAVALAAVTSAYTALKAAPTGGADNTVPKGTPPLLQRIIFAIAPPLLLLVLGIVLSWLGNNLYETVHASAELQRYVAIGAVVSGLLFLVFALYEFRPPQRWKSVVVVIVWIVVLAAAYLRTPELLPEQLVSVGVVTLVLLAVALVFRALLRKRRWILGYAALLGATAWWIQQHAHSATLRVDDPIPQYVLAGAIATLVLLLFELLQGRGANTRSIALTVIACTIFVLVGAAAGMTDARVLTIVGLIATVLGWVLALGWLADPNSLTMHNFYKSRLVRAYMGASNEERAKAAEADITDAVPNDDILLTQLRNTERGAPYHLVNTMLNLVGGSDLSTQARASDAFLMSKNYCGSSRTGYRKTTEYACGSISLGTAVAVSGAAASPTMGAQTPSAALSALLTLFNVRTGYWAPTPNLGYWRSGSARLWPVYTLQELVSQTTDLLPYCYLTDGGHYENTGVYSLVQRGCNLIVVSDCGADPKTTLDDLGNMIRKVRIDFGAEVCLDIRQLRDKKAHVVVGTIHYSDEHAAALNLPKDERTGTIVVIKPNLAGGEPVDVQQYGFLNEEFPQQQTFDLWYDEAQFESYRRLGLESGRLAVATRTF